MSEKQKYRGFEISVYPTPSREMKEEGRAAFTASASIMQYNTFLEGWGDVITFGTGMGTWGDTPEQAEANVKAAVDEHYENKAREIIPLAVLPRDG